MRSPEAVKWLRPHMGRLHHLHGYRYIIILSTGNVYHHTCKQSTLRCLHAALSAACVDIWCIYIMLSMQSKTCRGFPRSGSGTKMAIVNLQEFEVFLLSLKDKCCESVLEISMKCVRAMKLNQFSEAVSFNQVRKSSRLCRRRSTYVRTCVLWYASRVPGPSVYVGVKPTHLYSNSRQGVPSTLVVHSHLIVAGRLGR